MDGDSCCFISTTFPFFLLRFLLLQSRFLSPIWIISVRSYLDSFYSLPFLSSILFSLSLSFPFFILYFLTLILLWALVNSDWFTCHSFFELFLLFPSLCSLFPLLHCRHITASGHHIVSALSNYAFVTKISTGTGLHARMNTHSRLEDKQTHWEELECVLPCQSTGQKISLKLHVVHILLHCPLTHVLVSLGLHFPQLYFWLRQAKRQTRASYALCEGVGKKGGLGRTG